MPNRWRGRGGGDGLDRVAAGQGGVVDRAQCLAVGITDAMIRVRVTSGRWQRLFTGVFATFSGPLPRAALFWAALLHAGRDAVLSHESAAELAGLLDRPYPSPHVTVPATRRVRPAPGMVIHRSRRLAQARHPTRVPPQTRIEETVVDLAETARHLDTALSWLATACGRRLTTPDRIAAAIRQRGRVRWRRELLAALDDVADGCHSLLDCVTCATWNDATACLGDAGRTSGHAEAAAGTTTCVTTTTPRWLSWTDWRRIQRSRGRGIGDATTRRCSTGWPCSVTARRTSSAGRARRRYRWGWRCAATAGPARRPPVVPGAQRSRPGGPED